MRAHRLGSRSGWGLRGRGGQESAFPGISDGSEMAVSPWGSQGTAWIGGRCEMLQDVAAAKWEAERGDGCLSDSR